MRPFFLELMLQTGVSFNLIAILCFVHLYIPTARQHTSKFFWLSHYNPSTGQYGAGEGDCYFLAFCIVFFTGLRAGFMSYVLAPLAKQLGISKKKDVTRFSEQAWLVCYYSIFWTLGMVRLRLCCFLYLSDILVHLLHVKLLSEHEGDVHQLAHARAPAAHQGVHLGAMGLLAAADYRHQH